MVTENYSYSVLVVVIIVARIKDFVIVYVTFSASWPASAFRLFPIYRISFILTHYVSLQLNKVCVHFQVPILIVEAPNFNVFVFVVQGYPNSMISKFSIIVRINHSGYSWESN